MRAILPILLFCLSTAAQSKPLESFNILFGSCSHQDKAMPIFDAINREQADLFIFLGDNIYGDTEDMAVLKSKYDKLGQQPGFRRLIESTDVIAIWDDHDYGENDAGREYQQKQASRDIMLDFWGEPNDSPRRSRKDGIYTSVFFGEGERSIQVIMPDLRWNRPPLNSRSYAGYWLRQWFSNEGPYLPVAGDISMLGEAQWQWLEQELKKPAAVRIIASSLQLLPEFTGWESWANFPYDRNRLLKFIREHKVNGVVMISGDTHWGEISRVEQGLDYPLWEVTSSGLTQEWKQVSPNKHRVGEYTAEVNYGQLLINWNEDGPQLIFGLKNANGDWVMSQQLLLESISPY
ncbi:alkaline phosphatase family protein [Shewanella corallii]|uniref:Alkaline phosphatase family protein n=1 Tax=Shewanella corallii TaxID=560080 RepID=A0ABT0N503_9GAMM|nr:alkaline phosphatase D family protein [Shewanella corallii]MCL2913533.1 alkaline phosphatase family protein [Shewanella corallii]